MNDRLQSLEREKLDLIERHAKSEEELRDSFAVDRAKLNEKVDKLKKQLADKDETIDTANKKVSDLEKEMFLVKKENDSLF
jgi:chromosome segregation ATPase